MIYGHGGVIERKRIINEIKLLHNEIDSLRDEKAKLNWEIKILSNNREYLAGIAHENGYREENEYVFKFLKKDSWKK